MCMEIFRPPFFPGQVAHLMEICITPSCSAGQRHPPETELIDQITIIVFATKISTLSKIMYTWHAVLFYIRQLLPMCILLQSLTEILAFFQYFPFDEFRWLKIQFFTSPEKSDFLFFFFFPFSNLCWLSSSFLPLPDLSFRPQHCGARRTVSVHATTAASKRAF